MGEWGLEADVAQAHLTYPLWAISGHYQAKLDDEAKVKSCFDWLRWLPPAYFDLKGCVFSTN